MVCSSAGVEQRRWRCALAAAAAALVAVPGCSAASGGSWRMAWRSEIVFADRTSTTMTCRAAAAVAGAGSQLRAEFASPLGRDGFRILAAGVGRAAAPGVLAQQPGSLRRMTFGGRPDVLVPPGGQVLSDAVPLHVSPGEILTVTMTVGAGDAARKADVSEPFGCAAGQVPLDAAAADFGLRPNQAWLRTLLLRGPGSRSIVAVGDSLTEDAYLAPTASYVRWTDVLARRGVPILNAGVSGGELTGVGLFGSVTGLWRVRQALAEPGLTDLVLCLGTNDLAVGVPADRVLAAMRTAVAATRAAGVRAWVATIPPRFDIRWNAAYEQQRVAVNSRLRDGFARQIGAGLIDLDAALRDPVAVTLLLPIFDGGDHLHLTPAGERAFAQAVAEALGLPGG